MQVHADHPIAFENLIFFGLITLCILYALNEIKLTRMLREMKWNGTREKNLRKNARVQLCTRSTSSMKCKACSSSYSSPLFSFLFLIITFIIAGILLFHLTTYPHTQLDSRWKDWILLFDRLSTNCWIFGSMLNRIFMDSFSGRLSMFSCFIFQ